MTDATLHERRICRVFIRAADLAIEPIVLPHGAQIVRIMPCSDTWEEAGFFDHVVVLRHEDLPEVQRGERIPERRLLIEHKVRDMGPYTKLTQLEARFE